MHFWAIFTQKSPSHISVENYHIGNNLLTAVVVFVLLQSTYSATSDVTSICDDENGKQRCSDGKQRCGEKVTK